MLAEMNNRERVGLEWMDGWMDKKAGWMDNAAGGRERENGKGGSPRWTKRTEYPTPNEEYVRVAGRVCAMRE